MGISYRLLLSNKNRNEINIIQDKELSKLWDNVYDMHFNNIPWINNPVPNDILKSFIESIENKDNILDYGAGNGIFLNLLSQYFSNITCAEVSKKALELCKKQDIFEPTNIEYVLTDFPYTEYFKINSFDGVILWGVLHHIEKNKWKNYLDVFYKILVKGGKILVGGHSNRDNEVVEEKSPYTGNLRYPFDNNFEKIYKSIGFKLVKKGQFPFKEAITGKNKDFDYYILEK